MVLEHHAKRHTHRAAEFLISRFNLQSGASSRFKTQLWRDARRRLRAASMTQIVKDIPSALTVVKQAPGPKSER